MIFPITAIILAGGHSKRTLLTDDRTYKLVRSYFSLDPLIVLAVKRCHLLAAQIIILTGKYDHEYRDSLKGFEDILRVPDSSCGSGTALLNVLKFSRFNDLLCINADTINDWSYRNFIHRHFELKHTSSILLSKSPTAQNPNSYVYTENLSVIKSFEDDNILFRPKLDGCSYAANTGVLMLSKLDLLKFNVLPNMTIERDIVPSLIKYKLIKCIEGGEFTTYDLGVKSRIDSFRSVSEKIFLRKD